MNLVVFFFFFFSFEISNLLLLIFGRGGPSVVVGVGRVGLSLKQLNPTILVSAYDQLIICFETKLSKIASSSKKSNSQTQPYANAL